MITLLFISLWCNIQLSFAQYPKLHLARIDLQKYINGDIQERMEVVSSFNKNLHELGALTLINHGIPTEILNQLQASAEDFFSQTEEYKTSFNAPTISHPGYEGFKSFSAGKPWNETRAVTNGTDFHESFKFFNYYDVDGRQYKVTDEDVWFPLHNEKQTPKELYNISKVYLTQIRRVLAVVHHIASEALLGINNSDYFDDMYAPHNKPALQVRMFNYPAYNLTDTENEDTVTRFRLGPHQDYLGFSLFKAGVSRGLQHKIGNDNESLWIDIETDNEYKNDIFVHCGELIEFWTNGYWKAGLHRVIFDRYPQQRTTHSFFSAPRMSSLIEPIKNCAVCNEKEFKYEVKTIKQHQFDRYGKQWIKQFAQKFAGKDVKTRRNRRDDDQNLSPSREEPIKVESNIRSEL
eukprot:45337_1